MTDVGQNPGTDTPLAVSCQGEYDPESISAAEAGERSKRTQASGKFLRRSALVGKVVVRELCADYDWRSFACRC